MIGMAVSCAYDVIFQARKTAKYSGVEWVHLTRTNYKLGGDSLPGM